jgi:hypothetical protein
MPASNQHASFEPTRRHQNNTPAPEQHTGCTPTHRLHTNTPAPEQLHNTFKTQKPVAQPPQAFFNTFLSGKALSFNSTPFFLVKPSPCSTYRNTVIFEKATSMSTSKNYISTNTYPTDIYHKLRRSIQRLSFW